MSDMTAKNNKILGMKRNAAIAATILAGAALPFFLRLTCTPHHETIFQTTRLEAPCPCGDSTVIDTTRHVGKLVDTLVASQRCVPPNKAPEPPKPKPPKKQKKEKKAEPPVVEKKAPAPGCIPCAAAMYAPNTNGESVHMMLSTAITGSHGNAIKNTFGNGEKVIVKCVVTVGSSSKVEGVNYTVYKDGLDVTSKGDIASMLGVNPVGFEVSYPGASCCTFNFTVVLP